MAYKGMKTPQQYLIELDMLRDHITALIPDNPIILKLTEYEDIYTHIKGFTTGLDEGKSANYAQKTTALREAQQKWMGRKGSRVVPKQD